MIQPITPSPVFAADDVECVLAVVCQVDAQAVHDPIVIVEQRDDLNSVVDAPVIEAVLAEGSGVFGVHVTGGTAELVGEAHQRRVRGARGCRVGIAHHAFGELGIIGRGSAEILPVLDRSVMALVEDAHRGGQHLSLDPAQG